MKIKLVKTTDVKPYAGNPRQNDGAVSAVADSIREFGFRQPIVVDSENVIVAGHTRWKAAQKLGIEKIPVHVADELTPAQVKAYRIADNKTGELAEWNMGLLKIELDGLKDLDFDLSKLGFDGDEIAEAMGVESEGLTDPDDVPEAPEEPTTKAGDLWLMGDHRLLCGDSAKAEDVERLMNGSKLNMAFTSPPYASQRKYDESSGFCPIPPDEFVAWFEPIQENIRKHCVNSASWFVNIKEHAEDGGRNLYVKDLVIAHVRLWKWMFVDEFCWYKTGVPGSWPDRFRNDWEPVFHFSTQRGFTFKPTDVAVESDDVFDYVKNSNKSHNGNVGIDRESRHCRRSGLALPGNVLKISTRKVPDGIKHEAAFPVDLPSFFIKAYSASGDVVYEPFCGSGTTLIAAEQLGRKCYGMEISPKYCDVIVKRWEDFTGKKARRA